MPNSIVLTPPKKIQLLCLATTINATSSNLTKRLVTGAANSSLQTFFLKLATLQSKHHFDLCLALDLFSDVAEDSTVLNDLLAGRIDVPVQVYAGIGGGVLPERIVSKIEAGEQICNNVSVLSKTGLLTLASGLRIGTFGGSYDATVYDTAPLEGEEDPIKTSNFTSTDLNTFLNLLTPIASHPSLPPPLAPTPDILLSHCAPSLISNHASKPLTPAKDIEATSAAVQVFSPILNQVAKKAASKYHFIGGTGVFWEREPFSWPKEEGHGVCRVIALGELGNKNKERWFYAFSITPGQPQSPPQQPQTPQGSGQPLPANLTPSPFYSPKEHLNQEKGRGIKRPAGALEKAGVNEYGVPNYIFGAGRGAGGTSGGRGGRHGGVQSNEDRNGKKGKGGPPPDHYTCKICEQKGHWIQDCPEKVERDAARAATRNGAGTGGGATGPRRPIQPDECWFCLSNPKVTKHLIVSIGSETYVTLPKGQLPPTSDPTLSPVPGGGHVLIIPIAHYPTILSVPADVAVPIISEIEQYKSALRDCYAEFGAGMLSFEVGRLSGKGGHAHVQICPIPNELISKAEDVFREEGKKQNIEFENDSSDGGPGSLLKNSGVVDNYFRVDLPNGKSLVHIIKPGTPFNLQFGRFTAAALLGTPDRGDWKACTKSDAEEKNDTARFKGAFKSFDPTE